MHLTQWEVLQEIGKALALCEASPARDELVEELWRVYRSNGGLGKPTTPTSGSTCDGGGQFVPSDEAMALRASRILGE
jgi:hypothetical protein